MALASGLIVAGTPGLALAEEFSTDSAEFSGARLTVTRALGAGSCPGAARITEGLRPLGIVRPREDALDVRIELRPTPEGFAALITVSGEHAGIRDLRSPGPDCSGLEADLTASLALLLDQRAESGAPAEPPKPVPSAARAAPPPRVTKPPPAPRRKSGRAAASKPPDSTATLHFSAAGGAGAAILLVGTVAPAFAASGWMDAGSFSAGATLFSTLDESSALGTGRVDVRLTGGHVRGCASLFGERASVNARFCAGAALAALRGQAKGYVTVTDAAYRPWYALGTGAVLGGPIAQRLGWNVDATVLLPLHRESFSVRPAGAAFQTPYGGVLTVFALTVAID